MRVRIGDITPKWPVYGWGISGLSSIPVGPLPPVSPDTVYGPPTPAGCDPVSGAGCSEMGPVYGPPTPAGCDPVSGAGCSSTGDNVPTGQQACFAPNVWDAKKQGCVAGSVISGISNNLLVGGIAAALVLIVIIGSGGRR